MFSLITGLFGTVTSAASGISLKTWLIIAMVVCILLSAGCFYWSYDNLQDTVTEQQSSISQLTLDKQDLTDKLSMSENTLKLTKAKYEEIRTINKGLADTVESNQKAINALQNKLNKAGRDLGDIAVGKPVLVENIVNKASRDRNRCFEVLSGKPQLKGEKNEVCPHLFIK